MELRMSGVPGNLVKQIPCGDDNQKSKGQQQIPYGDDNQKSKGNSNSGSPAG